MNLVKCANGHFYDASKFASCPHCSSSNQDLTVPVNPQADMPTVPLTVQPTAMQPLPDPDFVQTVPIRKTVNEITPPPAVQDPRVQPLSPTPPAGLAGAPAQAPKAASEDDQHTIGYYGTESEPGKKWIDPVVGWLVIISGEQRGKSVQLKAGRNFIGRAETNDIVLAGDKTISREKHAIIVFEPRTQSFLLQPGTSKELFYVNNEVVLDTKAIQAYDVLDIGKTKLVFIPFCGELFSWDEDEVKKD